jgi:hypothetical protein
MDTSRSVPAEAVEATGTAAPRPAAAGRSALSAVVDRPARAAALAGALGLIGWVLQWRGGDLPAQLHRATLVAHDGFVLWDASWFGGHLTPGYSVLVPVVAAWVGIWPLAVASAAAASWAFDALMRRHAPAAGAAPGLWFAAGTVVNLAVGRVTFAVGLALGLLALLAASHRRTRLALLLAVLTPLASPVAGAFLALAWVAQAATMRKWRLLLPAAVTAAPVAVTTALFPRGGDFPFGPGALLVTLLACVLVGWVIPPVAPVVRVGAALYGAGALVTFVAASPLGANITRLGMFVAWPLLVAGYTSSGASARWRAVPADLVAAWRSRTPGRFPGLLAAPSGRSVALLAAAPLLLAWQWTPAIDGFLRAGGDPSTKAEFHAPLVRFLDRQGSEPFRVEVVPLARHGEAAHVAAEHDLARGWDRQLDRLHNELFYDGSLTETEYRTWLAEEGVRFVALARAPLDSSGREEAALLRAGVDGLQPVLSTANWQVWEVEGFTDMVLGPGRLVAVGSDEIVVEAESAGFLLAKVRTPGRWQLDGSGCLLEPSVDGWLRLRASGPGVMTLHPAGLEVAGPGCSELAARAGHQPRRSMGQVSSTWSPLSR